MNASVDQPLILALETSAGVCSVAVFQGEVLLGHSEIFLPQGHARTLAPTIRHLLQMVDVEMAALQAVAVTSGPGSYTGLRVGASTAKGLCMALDIPLISVPTLEALAWQGTELAQKIGARICPLMDARRMEVYTQLFDPFVRALQPVSAMVVEENSMEEILQEGPVMFIGDGVRKVMPFLQQHPQAWLFPELTTTARTLGVPLLRKYRLQEFESLDDFAPFYLKEVRITTPKSKVSPPAQDQLYNSPNTPMELG